MRPGSEGHERQGCSYLTVVVLAHLQGSQVTAMTTCFNGADGRVSLPDANLEVLLEDQHSTSLIQQPRRRRM